MAITPFSIFSAKRQSQRLLRIFVRLSFIREYVHWRMYFYGEYVPGRMCFIWQRVASKDVSHRRMCLIGECISLENMFLGECVSFDNVLHRKMCFSFVRLSCIREHVHGRMYFIGKICSLYLPCSLGWVCRVCAHLDKRPPATCSDLLSFFLSFFSFSGEYPI